jgi:LmbE family N-acetylglucosaminyl deacetylase
VNTGLDPSVVLGGPLLLLSPHPDDLCFSAGGLLARGSHGAAQAIVAFSRSRYAPQIPAADGDETKVSALRGAEDDRYFATIGATRMALDLPDCTLRTDRWQDYFEVDCGPALRRRLLDAIGPLVRDRPSTMVLSPLAIGGHRDHLAVRDTAMATVPIERLVFYEDLPYASECADEEIRALVSGIDRSLTPTVVPIADGIRAKLDTTAACYPSQLLEEDRRAIEAHAHAVGGAQGPAERIWSLRWR